MGKSALELRADITRIRGELDDTLDELGDHVRPRRIYERKTRRVRARVASMREAVMGSAQDATSGAQHGIHQLGDHVAGAASDVADKARETPDAIADRTRGNPLAAGLVAFGVGMVLGSLAPPTAQEQRTVGALEEKLEPLKDKAIESAQQVRSEVTDAARESAETVKGDARDAMQEVKQQAQDSTNELKDQAQEGMAQVRQETRSPS